jgi:hypothetical protein
MMLQPVQTLVIVIFTCHVRAVHGAIVMNAMFASMHVHSDKLVFLQPSTCGCEDKSRHRQLAFDGMGETYDSKVGWDEAVMGIPLLRWSLAALATGKVCPQTDS